MRSHLELFNVKIRFSFWFFAVITLIILLDYQILLFYMATPIAIHELGHLIVMICCGFMVTEIYFTPVSIRIKRLNTRALSYSRELMVAFGGIAANLLAAFLLWRFAFASMRTMLMIATNLAVAFFNLLPIGDLDGGQIMKTTCSKFMTQELAERVSLLVSFIILVPLTAVAAWLLLSGHGNFTLALTCIYLIATIILRK